MTGERGRRCAAAEPHLTRCGRKSNYATTSIVVKVRLRVNFPSLHFTVVFFPEATWTHEGLRDVSEQTSVLNGFKKCSQIPGAHLKPNPTCHSQQASAAEIRQGFRESKHHHHKFSLTRVTHMPDLDSHRGCLGQGVHRCGGIRAGGHPWQAALLAM